MFKENIFKCPSCGEDFDFERLCSSIMRLGFINLFSENKEIFAVNCPKQECSSLWQFHLEPGRSDVILGELQDEMDPSGYDGVRFDYYSSMPLTFQAHGILKSLGYIKIDSSDIDSEFASDYGDRFDKGFYSCCPKSTWFSAFNEKYTIWFYPGNIAEVLLNIENNTKIMLLPRIFLNNELFKMVDKFFYENSLKYEHLKSQSELKIPSLTASLTGVKLKKLPRKIPKKINPFIFQVSSERKVDTTALSLYQILSYDWFDMGDPFINMDPEISDLQFHHNIMMEQTFTYFNKGMLNDILFRMSSIFIQDYVDYFMHTNLSFRSLWIFKEKFLETLYEACLSEKIFEKKGKPRSDRIVKLMVQAAAEEYWSWDPKITKEEMIKKDEIIGIREIGTWTDKTIIDWLNNLKPKS